MNEAFSQLSMPIIAARLSSTVSLSRPIQRSRNRNNVHPPNHVTVDSLVIPSEYTLILSNLPFLLYDSKNNENLDINNRILIFKPNKYLNILNDSKIWFADGTFKYVPNIFNQLYTIHGSIDYTVYPLIY